MKNWKTTTLGVLTIVAALSNAGAEYLNGHPINMLTLGAAITAGWGLIHASDAKAAQ
jgi:hypothetical protein